MSFSRSYGNVYICRNINDMNHNTLCTIINQFHSIETKIKSENSSSFYQRRFDKINMAWEDLGLTVLSPLGENYDETRTDCEASIAGDSVDNLKITEVIKPIIYYKENNENVLIQQGVVIVESN